MARHNSHRKPQVLEVQLRVLDDPVPKLKSTPPRALGKGREGRGCMVLGVFEACSLDSRGSTSGPKEPSP